MRAGKLQRGLHVMRRDAYDEEHGREPPIPTEDEEGFYEGGDQEGGDSLLDYAED